MKKLYQCPMFIRQLSFQVLEREDRSPFSEAPVGLLKGIRAKNDVPIEKQPECQRLVSIKINDLAFASGIAVHQHVNDSSTSLKCVTTAFNVLGWGCCSRTNA